MLSWQQRSEEEAYLFNPAFCSILIGKTVEDLFRRTSRGMDLSLAFLILPVVLHEDTRQALPRSTATSMLAWIQGNSDRLIGFADRTRQLRPITREAIMFGLAHELLEVASDGVLIGGWRRVSATDPVFDQSTEEVRQCIDRARFFGRWIAGAGTPGTILASWGIAP